jgi:gamma-butyrobetaine hydroxylase
MSRRVTGDKIIPFISTFDGYPAKRCAMVEQKYRNRANHVTVATRGRSKPRRVSATHLGSPLLGANVLEDGATLLLTYDRAPQARFAAAWLRDHCPCDSCSHASGQRLFDVAAMAATTRVESIELDDEAITIRFAPDQHEAHFDASTLLDYYLDGESVNEVLWDSSLTNVDFHDYESVANNEGTLRDYLVDVERRGFALLRGAPVVEGTVTKVAEFFGFVRETNYGRLFDVRTEVNPSNLAFTSLGLGAHTDNPYRNPVPTLQLLHCLASSIEGGASIFVDGFRIADDLRQTDARAFELLATVPIGFRYRDEHTDLVTQVPVIELDVMGNVTAIRFNTRSARPPAQPAKTMASWYQAYREFAEMLRDSRYAYEVALRPGDVAMFLNTRILHGRTAFDATQGTRHLQGCYADIDALRSKISVLSRGVKETASN